MTRSRQSGTPIARIRTHRRTAALAALAVLVPLAPARADFFDDVRRTFQTDIPRTFQHDIPRAFGAEPRKPSPRPAVRTKPAKPPASAGR